MIKLNSNRRIRHEREKQFVENYHVPNCLVYEPTTFYLRNDRNGKYTPDFYDVHRGVFIEVVGSRQAFGSNKNKYRALMVKYPELRFELRRPDGTEIKVSDNNLRPSIEKNTGEDMKRTNIHLPDQQRKKLKALGKKTGLRPAELVRRFIDEGLEKQATIKKDEK